MALNANALTTLVAMKIFVKVPTAEVTQDANLEGFINGASELVERYLNRRVYSANYSEQYNGDRGHEILLRHWPINSISDIFVDPERVFPASSAIDVDDFGIVSNELGEGISVERYSQGFPKGRKTVKVDYDAGYNGLANLPSDIELACKITAAYYFKKQQNEDWTFSSMQKGDETITVLVQGIPEAAKTILEEYRRSEIFVD